MSRKVPVSWSKGSLPLPTVSVIQMHRHSFYYIFQYYQLNDEISSRKAYEKINQSCSQHYSSVLLQGCGFGVRAVGLHGKKRRDGENSAPAFFNAIYRLQSRY